MSSHLHVRCTAAELREALSEVTPAIPSRTTLPALECVHLHAEDNTLALTATNLDLRISARCPATVPEAGKALVPARLFWDIVRSLEKEEEVSLRTEGTTVVLETSYGRYSLSGLAPEEFPAADNPPPATVELSPDILRQIVQHVLFAVSEEPIRLALTGVLWEFRSDALFAVATDGYRLSRLRVDFNSPQQGSLLIPADTVELLRRIDSPVHVGWDEGSVSFSTPTLTIVGRLIAERFPAYEQVIPTENPRRCIIDRERFLRALERVSLFSPSQARIVRFHFAEGGVTLRAEDESRGDRAQEVVSCSWSGEELTIGFNASYLSEALKAAQHNELLLEFSEPTKPVVIRWAEAAELPVLQSPLVILVMPVRL
ncbi:MAG: DNA polymerase III subunit beta [Candidatus Kapabacteria bacterium]|nr:DNA polymerase III subunit beta [Candidatus Kapabacteria bacterium]MDW8011561.1 DNA polymerase III subunit beta [Bacteroidota bacterium]